MSNDVDYDGGQADREEEAEELSLEDKVDADHILLHRAHLKVTNTSNRDVIRSKQDTKIKKLPQNVPFFAFIK